MYNMIRTRQRPLQRCRRRGAGSIDYVLTLAVLFTMSGFIVASGRRIMQLVYELTGFFLAWPFM
jgi:hypothetical protein